MNRWDKDNLIEIVSVCDSGVEVLKRLGLIVGGNNWKTLEKYLSLYNIDTSHFKKLVTRKKSKLCDVLVENSSYNRTHLKERLYKENLLERKCCICGQDENWNGVRISLILDHINGVNNDNRIENLRIVCPNCNAGLDTFAGRNSKRSKRENYCLCGNKMDKDASRCRKCYSVEMQRVERPPIDQLIKEVVDMGYSATGRKYGVSDNAIRKWIKIKE